MEGKGFARAVRSLPRPADDDPAELRRASLVVRLPARDRRPPLWPPGRQALPAPRRALLRLSTLPRPDLHQLSGEPQTLLAVTDAVGAQGSSRGRSSSSSITAWCSPPPE